eukprot:TRINITY_DN408_c5_g1_i1.p1 TRINITY_DN408_c5_g1~~TRINITY_DN408_c5_g1_i1.p1  ORF type:complete len:1295 (+),score=430.00 TRINITY_DN408_c5_g1_i1:2296-6180(+)
MNSPGQESGTGSDSPTTRHDTDTINTTGSDSTTTIDSANIINNNNNTDTDNTTHQFHHKDHKPPDGAPSIIEESIQRNDESNSQPTASSTHGSTILFSTPLRLNDDNQTQPTDNKNNKTIRDESTKTTTTTTVTASGIKDDCDESSFSQPTIAIPQHTNTTITHAPGTASASRITNQLSVAHTPPRQQQQQRPHSLPVEGYHSPGSPEGRHKIDMRSEVLVSPTAQLHVILEPIDDDTIDMELPGETSPIQQFQRQQQQFRRQQQRQAETQRQHFQLQPIDPVQITKNSQSSDNSDDNINADSSGHQGGTDGTSSNDTDAMDLDMDIRFSQQSVVSSNASLSRTESMVRQDDFWDQLTHEDQPDGEEEEADEPDETDENDDMLIVTGKRPAHRQFSVDSQTYSESGSKIDENETMQIDQLKGMDGMAGSGYTGNGDSVHDQSQQDQDVHHHSSVAMTLGDLDAHRPSDRSSTLANRRRMNRLGTDDSSDMFDSSTMVGMKSMKAMKAMKAHQVESAKSVSVSRKSLDSHMLALTDDDNEMDAQLQDNSNVMELDGVNQQTNETTPVKRPKYASKTPPVGMMFAMDNDDDDEDDEEGQGGQQDTIPGGHSIVESQLQAQPSDDMTIDEDDLPIIYHPGRTRSDSSSSDSSTEATQLRLLVKKTQSDSSRKPQKKRRRRQTKSPSADEDEEDSVVSSIVATNGQNNAAAAMVPSERPVRTHKRSRKLVAIKDTSSGLSGARLAEYKRFRSIVMSLSRDRLVFDSVLHMMKYLMKVQSKGWCSYEDVYNFAGNTVWIFRKGTLRKLGAASNWRSSVRSCMYSHKFWDKKPIVSGDPNRMCLILQDDSFVIEDPFSIGDLLEHNAIDFVASSNGTAKQKFDEQTIYVDKRRIVSKSLSKTGKVQAAMSMTPKSERSTDDQGKEVKVAKHHRASGKPKSRKPKSEQETKVDTPKRVTTRSGRVVRRSQSQWKDYTDDGEGMTDNESEEEANAHADADLEEDAETDEEASKNDTAWSGAMMKLIHQSDEMINMMNESGMATEQASPGNFDNPLSAIRMQKLTFKVNHNAMQDTSTNGDMGVGGMSPSMATTTTTTTTTTSNSREVSSIGTGVGRTQKGKRKRQITHESSSESNSSWEEDEEEEVEYSYDEYESDDERSTFEGRWLTSESRLCHLVDLSGIFSYEVFARMNKKQKQTLMDLMPGVDKVDEESIRHMFSGNMAFRQSQRQLQEEIAHNQHNPSMEEVWIMRRNQAKRNDEAALYSLRTEIARRIGKEIQETTTDDDTRRTRSKRAEMKVQLY